jgi:hypothetical protein
MKIIIMLAALSSAILAGEASTPRTISDIAYDIARKQMSQAEWDKYCKDTEARFRTWVNDHDGSGDLGNYLNEKLLEIAPAARGGDVPALKRLVPFIALYHHFKEQPPERLASISQKYITELEELAADFTWEKLSASVKRHAKDIEQDSQKQKK